jgi:ribosomal protein S18 acetylase RimI-like enzyme
MEIIEPRAASLPLLTGLQALVAQLSPRTQLTLDRLAAIVASPAVRLLVATPAPDAYVGTLSLVLIPLPTGIRARIEDVVVDIDHRRLGIARALTTRAIQLAADARARDVDLTARPHRSGAQSLYESLAFEMRDTTVFRRRLGASTTT